MDSVRQWKSEIESLNLSAEKSQILIRLLIYATAQRFPELTTEEVQAMLELTPLDQTTVGRELIQTGREQGELIGEIRMAQKVLHLPITPKQELAETSIDELEKILRELEIKLS